MATRKSDSDNMQQAQHLEGRVVRLEGAVETLTSAVNEIGVGMKEINNNFFTLKDTIQSQLGKASAPKWPVIVGFGSLLLSIAGGMISFWIFIISGTNAAIASQSILLNKLADGLNERRYSDGQASEWRLNVDRNINDIYKSIDDKIAQVDNKHDIEIMGIKEHRDLFLSELSKELDDLRTWRKIHAEDNAKHTGSVDAQIVNLTKTIDILQNSTINNRWTKEDHQNYANNIELAFREIRDLICAIQEKPCK